MKLTQGLLLTVVINREKICGLCGNFNGNPNDDFHTPSGTIVTSPDEFGRAWKVPGNYTCNDGCGSSCPQCTNEQPARDQCEVIQAADGPFSFCHEEVDPAPYFNDCVFDVCLSGNQGHDLLCSAIESYVSACQSANVRIYPWRENTTCSESTCHYILFISKCTRNLLTTSEIKCPIILQYSLYPHCITLKVVCLTSAICHVSHLLSTGLSSQQPL